MNKFTPLILALSFLLVGCGFEIVDTGHRGVETRFGEVVGDALKEGLHFYNPATSNIVEIDVREQKWSDDTEASTLDVQSVQVGFTVNYRPKADEVHLIFKEVGKDWANKLLGQIVIGELKNAIAKYEAVDLIANRPEVVRAAEKGIKEAVSSRRMVVTRFEITNFQFSNEFTKAIEAKVTAQQRAAEAVNVTVRIEEEAKQKVIAAEAEATSIKIRTSALAKSPALINYEAVQKWDGKLPQYMLGSGTLPFLSIK